MGTSFLSGGYSGWNVQLPLISIKCRVLELVELHLYSPICLHGVDRENVTCFNLKKGKVDGGEG